MVNSKQHIMFFLFELLDVHQQSATINSVLRKNKPCPFRNEPEYRSNELQMQENLTLIKGLITT